MMRIKRKEQDDLRARRGRKARNGRRAGRGPLKTIDRVAGEDWAEIRTDYELLERGQAFQSRAFGIARTLVRLAAETAKPNADRLREYRESNLESLKQGLFSKAPIYDDLETVKLADSLSCYMERKGPTTRWSAR